MRIHLKFGGLYVVVPSQFFTKMSFKIFGGLWGRKILILLRAIWENMPCFSMMADADMARFSFVQILPSSFYTRFQYEWDGLSGIAMIGFLWVAMIALSSVYSAIEILVEVGWCAIYMLKRRGPMIPSRKITEEADKKEL